MCVDVFTSLFYFYKLFNNNLDLYVALDIDIEGWFNEELWKRIQNILPIATIDILPLKNGDRNDFISEGLILRKTADEGEKWCFIGGRLLYEKNLWEGGSRDKSRSL